MYTWEDIHNVDPEVADLIQKEFNRQNSHIELIASENNTRKDIRDTATTVAVSLWMK